jgi:hypothetical protein
MLLKTKNGLGVRMIHDGRWYNFSNGEIKECPDNMLQAFKGVLVQAESIRASRIIPFKPLPIIPVEQTKIKIPAKIKIKKKTK